MNPKRSSLPGIGIGAIPAVPAEPSFFRGEQAVAHTQLAVAHEPPRELGPVLRQLADGGAVAAVEAGVDVDGAEALQFPIQRLR
jgi:hypothetical protein